MMEYLEAAIDAARAAGDLLCENFGERLHVNTETRHDIKLELDVRTQELIARALMERFPNHALYGEEGVVGDQSSLHQWIVDPLDGTVNFFYGIPHFCVSIALREREQIVLGVIYDPIRDELWTSTRGSETLLNGKPTHVSRRAELSEAIVSVGLSKSATTIDAGLPVLADMVHRVRKCRLLGSAALDMAYVASGRFDAYIEQGISLWDVAAGWILVENAGGKVNMRLRRDMKDKYSVVATNGLLDLKL